MADRVRELRADDGQLPTLTPLKSTGTKPPLFLLHGRDGELMIYRNLVRSISPDQPVYGIQPVGLDGQRLPFMSLEEMAAHYVAELRSFMPNGPYLLAGYCFAGVLAYELAHQLTEAGHPPELLALIDASPVGHKPKETRAEIERAKLRAFLAADLHGKFRWVVTRARGLTYKLHSRALFALHDYAMRGGRWVPRSLVSVEGAMLSALRTYRTPSSSLHVTLLRAVPDELDAAPRSRWTPIADDVEIRQIVAPGIQHDNIVREPYVALLAAELEACIESALASRPLHRGDEAAAAV
jgi:thioesterase domain-containing protein